MYEDLLREGRAQFTFVFLSFAVTFIDPTKM